VMRGGPGLGNIAPAQGDYNQIVHGGGHGDYRPIVLAPSSIQEAIDLTMLAFDLAEAYRAIAVVLLDGSLGQMMEPAEMPPMRPLPATCPDWAVRGAMGRERRVLSSIYLDPPLEEEANLRILRRWQQVEANEVRYKEYYLDDARFVVVGFGTAGRVALSPVRAARAEGLAVGLLRPVTVSPFPTQVIRDLARQVEGFLVVEMNTGQMLEDVLRAVEGRAPVEFFARLGGVMPLPDEVLEEIHRMATGPLKVNGHPRDRWLQRMLQHA
jgi:2-oxoglutarate ferredoxin oxidoreductase subunit alpha